MGCNCSCVKEAKDLQFVQEQPHKPISDNYSPKEIQSLVKVQALVKGFLTRKTSSTSTNNSNKVQINSFSSQTQISNFQMSFTPSIPKTTLQQPQIYGPRIQRGPIRLDTGAVYTGQWNLHWQRHGQGFQTWPDGSQFEGSWYQNSVYGFGRLFHSTGEQYQGEWYNNKANGKGIYTHRDGKVYNGD